MPRTVVGLDIGSSAVRAVELRAGSRSVQPRRSGSVALPAGAVEGGLVRDPAAVTQALRQLWAETKISNRAVHLGIGSGSVLVRQLELDWMPADDLRRSLRYQVGDLLPVPIADANLDHVLLGESEGVDEHGQTRRLVRILLVATARTAVDDLVRCVHAARLHTVAADLAPFALIRLARRRTQEAGVDSGVEAVIDVGVDKVAVAVHTDGRPHFVRVVPGVGGGLLTRVLVEQTGRTWVDAELFKRSASALATPGDRPLDRDGEVLLEAARRLVEELRATLDFHAQSDPETAPVRAVLTGNGSLLPGLLEHFEAALGIPVRTLEGDPGLNVPLGLCLGAAS